VLAYGSQVESDVSVLCWWFVDFIYSFNLQKLIRSTKYIWTILVFHTKIKVFHSNKLTTSFTSQLAFFWFFRNWNHQIKVSSLATQSNYNSQTQELKYTETRQNKNYDYDFTSSNANSYEVWTKRRHEIKHKPKL
jgi:hypothetical protein